MNKRKALELCRDLWIRLRDDFADQRDLLTRKGQILTEMGYDHLRHDCPLCEYVGKLYRDCFEDCPLIEIWSEGCEHEDSPYSQAINAWREGLEHIFRNACNEIIREVENELAKCTKNDQKAVDSPN